MSKGFQVLVVLLLVLISALLLMSIDQGNKILEIEKQHSERMLQASENVLEVVSLKNRRGIPVYVRNTVDVDVQNREIPVDVRNSRIDVRMRDHYIIDGDPIPIRVVR